MCVCERERVIGDSSREATGIDVPVVVGGIIPPEDAKRLLEFGVARVYTPKDYDLNAIMAGIVTLLDQLSQAA